MGRIGFTRVTIGARKYPVKVPRRKDAIPPKRLSIASWPCLYRSHSTTCMAAHIGPHMDASGPYQRHGYVSQADDHVVAVCIEMDVFVTPAEFPRFIDECLSLNQLAEKNDISCKDQRSAAM